MAKYKMCPVCGEKNAEDAFNCINCDADLQSTQPMGDEEEKEPQTSRLVKICDQCGVENPSNANKCSNCRNDLYDVDAVEVGTEKAEVVDIPNANQNNKERKLVSVEGDYTFEIPSGETEIGREREMADYLADKMYVSRVQGKLTSTVDALIYENLSETNGTCIGNNKISAQVRLEDGYVLQLGHNPESPVEFQKKAAYFRVVI